MFTKLKRILKSEEGAVTVDWVVLTAAVVALAGAAYTSIQQGAGGVGTGVGEYLSDVEPGE